MEAYLKDKEFLTELCSQRERDVFARITALDLKGKPIEQIESKVTDGNISIDGSSAVRRTCSLTMVTESLDINEYYWGFKTQIKIEIGLKNNLNKYKNKEIIWFNMGVYLISTFSLSQSTTGITINISGKDKMCQLNGEMGGILMAQTDFGQIESYDEFGNRTLKKIPIQQIITDMIHQYANEDFSKIIVEDIEDYGLNLQAYRGSDPCYLFLLDIEDGARAPEQIETNGNRVVYVPCRYDETKIIQRLYEAASGAREIDSDEEEAILKIINNTGVVEPKHARAVQLYYEKIREGNISDAAIKKYIEDKMNEEITNAINEVSSSISEAVKEINVETIKKYHDYFYCFANYWHVLRCSAKLEQFVEDEEALLEKFFNTDVKAKCARALLWYGISKITGQEFKYSKANAQAIENYINWCKTKSPNVFITDYTVNVPENTENKEEPWWDAWWEAGRRRILRISAGLVENLSDEEYAIIKSFIANSDKVYARHARIYINYKEGLGTGHATAEDLNNQISDFLFKSDISIKAIRDYERQYGILSMAIEDINALFRTPIALSNLSNQEFNFIFNPGNKLTNEEITIPVYLAKDSTSGYYVRKIEYGDTIGYTVTELVYPEDLIANSGETLTSVLDKIKTMLGDFEYFYDVDGNFIFRKQRAYTEAYSAEDLLRLETKLKYEEEYEDDNGNIQTRTVDNDNSIFLIQSLDSNIDFEFKNLDLVTSISNNPAIGNIKNDYTVWGNKKGSGDNTIPIHMRYAIDTKPEEYHTVGLTPSRACLLIRVYPDIYPLQAGETEELAVRRMMAAHRARHFYSKVPARMKLQAERLVENYLIPMQNKLAKQGIEYSIDDNILEAAQELIKTLQNMTVKKVDFANDENYKIIKNFFEGGIGILQKKKDYNAKQIFNNFNNFLASFNEVIDNLYDWRELIYQMAKDYRFFNQTDEFRTWLEEANPMTCIDGKTGYEQYYIDMEGSWRNIYDKEYHQLKWNDSLEEGTVYVVDDDETEDQGTPLLYNTEKIYYKDDSGNRILMPDFDIYMPAATGESSNSQYQKIGTLYEIVKNNYKILELLIEKFVIDDWVKTHPEMIYRLQELHPNDSDDYINSHYLYMKDPQTWLKKRNEFSYHYADSEADQIQGFQYPYYHGGELASEQDKNFDTFLSLSKTPIDSAAWGQAQRVMAVLKSSSGIEIDTKNAIFPNMTQAEYAYCVINNVGPTSYSETEKKDVGDKLILLADASFGIKDKMAGLIALAMKEQNIYGISSVDGYISLILKAFDRAIAYEIFGKRLLKPDNSNLINFDIKESLVARLSSNFNGAIKSILGVKTVDFNSYDFSAYDKVTFFNLIAFAGDMDNDKKVTIKDLQLFIEDISDSKDGEEENAFKKYYSKIQPISDNKHPTLDVFVKEFYYRVTFDTSIVNALERGQFHSQLFSLVINSNVKRILKEAYLKWKDNGMSIFVNEFKTAVSKVVVDKFNLGDSTVDQSYDVFLSQIYYFLDFDEDGYFSLGDVQKIVKVANEDENLKQVSDSFKQTISFDGEAKATFYKARFVFFIFLLLYEKLDADGALIDSSNNELKEAFNKVINQLTKVLCAKVFLAELWILTLTPYAIERTIAGISSLRTPYGVADKILSWTWPGRTSIKWDPMTRVKNDLEGYYKEDWLYSEVRRRFGRTVKFNSKTYYGYNVFGSGERILQQSKDREVKLEASRFGLLCWPSQDKSAYEKDLVTDDIILLSSMSKIMDLVAEAEKADGVEAADVVTEYEQYLCAKLIDRSELWGDVNNDGKVTAKDARIALIYAENGPTLEEAKAAMEKEK